MVNNDVYRPNIGIVICNQRCQVLWARRYKQNSWQFPQGGINPEESPEQAMHRELFEEVGLNQKDVKILTYTKDWLRYKLPKHFIRWNTKPVYIGQKQRWFLLQLMCNEHNINVQTNKIPEFDNWRWVSYWYPIRKVVAFKRDVYRQVMKEFSLILMSRQSNILISHKNNSYRRSVTK